MDGTEESKRNQIEQKKTRESWRESEAREGDQRNMEGLEWRRVDWGKGRLGGERIERNSAGLNEHGWVERACIREKRWRGYIKEFRVYKRRDWRGWRDWEESEWIGRDWKRLRGC